MDDVILEVHTSITELVIGDAGETVVEIEKPVTVELLTIGVQGPQGIPGETGIAQDFIHEQTSASDEWIVNHNLGIKPNVQILDNGGNVVDAHVLHMSVNQLRVYFSSAQAGFVRCI